MATPAVRERSGASVSAYPRSRYEFTKRCLDLALGACLLALLAPTMCLVALLVRLTSPGPMLFIQERRGGDGRTFRVLKFRTMRVDAGPNLAFEQLNVTGGPTFKAWHDPRATAFGRWLRKYSLDELPQLVNVVRGEMSLVGPRPLECSEADRIPEWAVERFSVKPGLTCVWQVSGRSLVGFEDWMAMDLDYVRRRSLALDLELLLRTPAAVVSARGAC